MSIHTIDFSKSVSMETITDRIDELRSEKDDYSDTDTGLSWEEEYPQEHAELEELESIADELQGMGGDHHWEGNWYPAELIHENDFESRMDDMIDDCYPELSKGLPSWVSLTVDYNALKDDYTGHTFDGNEFYVR